MGVNDLSLDETKKIHNKEGDTDRYRCLEKVLKVTMKSREF